MSDTTRVFEVFCQQTISEVGADKLERFLRRAAQLAKGTSQAQMREACIEAGEMVFGDGQTYLVVQLLSEIMNTGGHTSAHGTGSKSAELLEKRRNTRDDS